MAPGSAQWEAPPAVLPGTNRPSGTLPSPAAAPPAGTKPTWSRRRSFSIVSRL